jgi:antitoxin component YwqK of YwqJK toxin-antitoxin module
MKETNWTNINGKQNGSITSYYNDGTLHFTENWVDGLKHGYFEYNWNNGKCFKKATTYTERDTVGGKTIGATAV